MFNRTSCSPRQVISRRDLFRYTTLLAGLGVPRVELASELPVQFSGADEAFLDELERANYLYFWEQADPQSGLVKDRCNVRGNDRATVASIAATGFGLTALCIAEKRGYISHPEARDRVLTTLRFLWKKLPDHRGFFYHFADVRSGERQWDSEVSSVDTAILLCGVLTCHRFFHHEEISDLAYMIFNRVDWSWLSEDTAMLSHGWMPEVGFLPYRWDGYSELMMLYLLGLGSYSHPCRRKLGTPGSEPFSSTTGFATSGRSRRFSFISIRRPGSISGGSGTTTRTIFRTLLLRRMFTNVSAWSLGGSFQTTVRICGALPHRTRNTGTWLGAALRRLVRSMVQSFLARRADLCLFFPRNACRFCERRRPGMVAAPGAVTAL